MKIIKKEIIDDATNYYDITVPKYHNFVLSNGAVVHNCGTGTGFSVQNHHTDKLPLVKPRNKGKKTFVIPDSIEGWADAIGVLLQSYFDVNDPFYVYDLQSNLNSFSGYEIEFDYSVIRPEGSHISWGGKAPGPEGLRKAMDKIVKHMDGILEEGIEKLRPIHVYDIIMHMSDAVLSGGVRRSACITLFSPEDDEMASAKTGDWFVKNPQRGRSNNSALLLRNETTKEQFSKLMKSVKEYGEPGFIWADSKETLFNPCCEITFNSYDEEGNSGWGFCNLCEINGRKCKEEEDFLKACSAASIIGTIQATYDKFDYLSETTERIVKRDALLGVSITGMMDSPNILFDEKIQRKASKLILETNEKISNILGINSCARSTCVKPAGSTSCILETASGIHPHHSKRYMRRVQANKLEFPAQHFSKINPNAVEDSVWSNNSADMVLTFLCEVPDGIKTKNQISAIELLENVKTTQKNWVDFGTRKNDWRFEKYPWLRHNVSNTINVKPDEWELVEKFIYENRKWFAGISLLPHSGDLDYPQAPFVNVLNEKELVQTYGEGTVFASGLVVDGLHAFNDNLWIACDCALGVGEKIEEISYPEEPEMPAKNGYTAKQWAQKLALYASELEKYQEDKEVYDIYVKKQDWVRRFKQFAERYCEGNLRKCTHMLKHVSLWKKWLDLKRNYKNIDWSEVVEDDYQIDVSSIAGAACSGPNGSCESGDLGAKIQEETTKHKNTIGDSEPTSAA